MLMPDYFYGKSARMTQLYDKLQEWILRDIARRILLAGEMTATADRMMWKLEQMGLHRAEIVKHLAALMAATEEEMRSLLQDAVLTSWADDAETWDSLGVHLSQPLENPEVVSVMDAEYKKSLGTMERLTRTTMEQSQQDLIRLLDDAELRVSSGMQSYDAAARSVLDDYAGKGTIVTYPTGARLTVEAAVRLNVVTSMNQTAGQVSNQYIKEVGTNYVIVSAHYGARVKRPDQPDLAGHDLWQGRVFCIQGEEPGIPNLLESTGYAIEPGLGIGVVVNPLGLHGYNCRHSHKPWDKSLRNPWRDENGNLLDGNGDIITPEKNEEIYHKRGRQRAIEREIRKTKRQMIVKEEEIKVAASETEKEQLTSEYSQMNERLNNLNRQYNDYCSANDLQPDYARNYVARFKTKTLKIVEKPKEFTILRVKNSELENGLSIKGDPNSIVDKIDDNGSVLQRRLYGPDGKASVDYDTSDHNAPHDHPTGAHKHVFDYSKKNPHGKPLPMDDNDWPIISDIIVKGVNYFEQK